MSTAAADTIQLHTFDSFFCDRPLHQFIALCGRMVLDTVEYDATVWSVADAIDDVRNDYWSEAVHAEVIRLSGRE